eukprot:TRINITY_DN9165_c0_g1_i1.p1 TRINITY_DN9165_c0_g1~~TRINITY_DN9165_c0_g1_i1.p1  ORF type:complete len:159 (+),score=55.47 TRINITY_DN9165_c0_g1_i1:234-710(+)
MVMEGHNNWILKLNILNGLLYSASQDGTIKIWNSECGKCLWTTNLGSPVLNLKISNGILFAVVQSDLVSFKMKKTSLKKMAVYSGHSQAITCLKILGEIVFSSSYDNTIRAWDIQSGKCLGRFSGHKDSVNEILIRNSSVLVSCSNDQSVNFWMFTPS